MTLAAARNMVMFLIYTFPFTHNLFLDTHSKWILKILFNSMVNPDQKV